MRISTSIYEYLVLYFMKIYENLQLKKADVVFHNIF